MREIKFRAWCETDNGTELIYFGDQQCNNGLWFDAPIHINEYISVMQYTGLKDKVGKEIYEGDVLKPVTNYLYKFGTMGVVEYNEDYAGYIVIGEYSKNQHHENLGCDLAIECEVIGNIYENPELLN